jgi:penicillin-binding protein 1C
VKKLLGAAAVGLVAIAIWIRCGSVPEIARETTPTIVDRNGEVLYEPLSSAGARSRWLASIPRHLAQATIAAEDKRFNSHIGVDPVSVARAVVHNLRARRVVEGGSTITQQVAKQMLPPSRRTISAKLRETLIALRLEHRHSKGELLALYCNLAPYGQQTIGAARASDRYFGCSPDQLTVAQSAYLAALPQRPGSPKRALARQKVILQRMFDLGMISREELDTARAERLAFERGHRTLIAPHFVQHVMSGQHEAAEGVIRTTLDAGLQRQVQGIIAAHREELLRHGAHSTAVAVLDNRTGEWLAWEGSGDYYGERFGGAIDGVTTPRQPGSTLKPFTYAVAFEEGMTPATVIADVPSHFPTAEAGIVYTPRNYDGKFRGPLRARSALAGSENVPAVAVLSKVGPQSLLRFLRRGGFTSLRHTADYYGVGLTLGDAEVMLEQLVTGYATLARGGLSVQPHVLSGRSFQASRVLSQRTAFWITDILSDEHAREFIFGAGGSLDFPFPVAAKTGTSQAYHDNWTIGYTREVTVGVWVGNFDREELRNSSGITGAAPIFHDVMLAAVRRTGGGAETIVERPADLEQQPVCALSGSRPSLHCPTIESEWLPVENRVEFCSWHRAEHVELPDEYSGTTTARTKAPKSVRVLSPAQGSTYLIDPTLRREFQALRLRANTDVRWTVDGKPCDEEWPLRGGKHTITAVDAAGNRDSVTIEVR